MLGHSSVVDVPALTYFLDQCQFKFGGIAKVPKNHPGERIKLIGDHLSHVDGTDPYHTYMSLAAISIYAPPKEILPLLVDNEQDTAGWILQPLDILWNTTEATSEWIRKCVVKHEL